jgi:hypothetical protein
MVTHHRIIFTDTSVTSNDEAIQAGITGIVYYLGLRHYTTCSQ